MKNYGNLISLIIYFLHYSGGTLNETDVVIDQLDGIVEINASAEKRKRDMITPSRRSNRLRHQNRYNQLNINIETNPRLPRRNLLIVEQGVVLKKMVIVYVKMQIEVL